MKTTLKNKIIFAFLFVFIIVFVTFNSRGFLVEDEEASMALIFSGYREHEKFKAIKFFPWVRGGTFDDAALFIVEVQPPYHKEYYPKPDRRTVLVHIDWNHKTSIEEKN